MVSMNNVHFDSLGSMNPSVKDFNMFFNRTSSKFKRTQFWFAVGYYPVDSFWF